MNVELKKVQIVTRLSQETTCFVADVYIDGKKVGRAENNGHGGCTMVYIPDTLVRQQLINYGRSLMPAEYHNTDPIEWVIDELVEKARAAKEDARIAKRIAKADADFKATCAKRGTSAARFWVAHPNGKDHRWTEYKRGSEGEARATAEKKFGKVEDWTVLA